MTAGDHFKSEDFTITALQRFIIVNVLLGFLNCQFRNLPPHITGTIVS